MGATPSLALFVVVLLLYAAVETQRRAFEARLAGIKRAVDAIAEHLHVDANAKVPPEVAGLLQAGRKIEAIKVYRRATGAGLADAKRAVEAIEATLPGPVTINTTH